MSHPLLHIRDLSLSYGAVRALTGVTLTLAAGEIVALLGANGAGKSSTLRAISRLHPCDAAELSFAGQDLRGRQAHSLPALGLIHAPEGRGIFTQLSVRENLALGAWCRGGTPTAEELDRIYRFFPVLRQRLDQMALTLSGGEQQMLAIARALLAKPRLLLLDEPSLGLAPKIVDTIFDILQQINADGVSILLVEQNAARALHIAHRAYVLESGQIVASGSSQQLLTSPEIRRAYLG